MSHQDDFQSLQYQRVTVMLGEAIARLGGTLEKGAAALGRPGTKAIRNKLVKNVRSVMVIYRLLVEFGDHAMPGQLAETLREMEGGTLRNLAPPVRSGARDRAREHAGPRLVVDNTSVVSRSAGLNRLSLVDNGGGHDAA